MKNWCRSNCIVFQHHTAESEWTCSPLEHSRISSCHIHHPPSDSASVTCFVRSENPNVVFGAQRCNKNILLRGKCTQQISKSLKWFDRSITARWAGGITSPDSWRGRTERKRKERSRRGRRRRRQTERQGSVVLSWNIKCSLPSNQQL